MPVQQALQPRPAFIRGGIIGLHLALLAAIFANQGIFADKKP